MPDGSEIPPTGRTVVIPHAVVIRHDGEKVLSWHTYMDQLSMLQQLGLAPKPAEA